MLLTVVRQYGLAFGVELKEYANGNRSLPIAEQRVNPPSYDNIRRRHTGFLSGTLPYRCSLVQCVTDAPQLKDHWRELQQKTLYALAARVLTDSESDVDEQIRE